MTMPDKEDINSDEAPDWLEGDKKLLKGIREIFVRNVPKQMEKIREAFASGDISTVELLSHTIKGSAAMIGAHPLRGEASKVERSAVDGDLEGARTSFLGMEREFEKTLSELTGVPRKITGEPGAE